MIRMKELFDKISIKTSQLTTNEYSTSFSLGIRLFKRRFHKPIYAVYGFVRLADEIVDSFHEYDKKALLDQFRNDTYQAISMGLSLNPILNSFQWVVNKYGIDRSSIDTFLQSMEMDLVKQTYTKTIYEKYILGSAEVVGLMCLRVFCEGDEKRYQELKPYAMALGAAFQKVNFLRDITADYLELGRTYFPDVDMQAFDDQVKVRLETDILGNFKKGYEGIRRLPKSVRLGVWVAYVYYFALFRKIKRTRARTILKKRIRISNRYKYYLLFKTYVKYQLDVE